MTESQILSDSDVLNARFRVEATNINGMPARKLYLCTYELLDPKERVWMAMPETAWHLLATVLPDKVVMRPVYVNPHAKRYLKPKHGRFTSVALVDDFRDAMLDNADAVASQIDGRLRWRIFDSSNYGFGLNPDLEAMWMGLANIPDTYTIVISSHPEHHISHGVVSLSINEIDKIRREFNRITRKGRELIRHAKHRVVHDEVLNRLNPEKFQRIVIVDRPLVEISREGKIRSSARLREERRSNIQTLRRDLNELVMEAPHEIILLHSEIERVTLAKMLEIFREKLASRLVESQWQKFFEQNLIVLSMAFARPVLLTHTQFHAKGSNLNGSGAQIGDFLFKEHGQALAIVEIKTPETSLLMGRAYRGDDIFAPHAELSGAVTQVLFQQSELRKRWITHHYESPSLQGSNADAVKCVVIAGRLPTDQKQLRSFEVFRNSHKDVDIITFDELLRKLELLEIYLRPQPEPVPF